MLDPTESNIVPSPRSKAIKLSRLMRDRLAESAPIDFQDVREMASGERGLTVGAVIVKKLSDLAMAGERWAVELIAAYTDGKPAQAGISEGDDADVEDRLADVTAKHLNDLTESILVGAGISVDSVNDDSAEEDSDGAGVEDARDAGNHSPARGLLDLPGDGDSDSEDDQ